MDQNIPNIDWNLVRLIYNTYKDHFYKKNTKFQIDRANSSSFEYLIGDCIDLLPQRLPKNIDVLRLYFNFPKHISEPQKISSIVKCVEDRYRENSMCIKGFETIRIKMKRLVKSCKDMVAKRKLSAKSHAGRQKHEKFHQSLYNLFDVADDSSVVQAVNSSIEFSESSLSQESDMLSSSDGQSSNPDEFSDSGPESDHDPDPDPDYDPSQDFVPSREKEPIPASLLREVSESRGSFRLCENLLNVGVRINGGNPNIYGISKSTIWSKITKFRSSQKNQLLASLAEDTCKIILQFDGKSCTRLNERHVGKEERFIIICHTINGDIPLGFFALNSKSGRDCATQILKSLTDYNLANRVVGLVCDTESANTGVQNGTCALVEVELEENLLHLMCRHHIKEVQLKDVFVTVFGRSQSSSITTFDMLIHNWDYIKNTGFRYAPIDNDRFVENELLQRLSTEAVNLISLHAKSKNIRDDYSELNDLVLKFLGIRTNIPFKVVGARNNARWMARIIYAMKAYLFREHLDLESDFHDSLERFCIFVALIYTKHWNRCSNAVDAPYNDLQLLKELLEYMEIDEEIANVALAAHKRHLWYLSDELVALAFFSNKVSTDDKLNMATQMVRRVGVRTENSIKHTTEIDDIQNIQLHNFISERSFFLFEQLQLNSEFLNTNPRDWNEMKSFKLAKQAVLDLIVAVNDSAERALQLGAQTITNKRVQSQSRLQDFIISTYGKKHSISLLHIYT